MPPHHRHRIPWGPVAVALLAVTLVGLAAIGLNLFGVGDRVENLARRIECSSSTRRPTGPSTRPCW